MALKCVVPTLLLIMFSCYAFTEIDMGPPTATPNGIPTPTGTYYTNAYELDYGYCKLGITAKQIAQAGDAEHPEVYPGCYFIDVVQVTTGYDTDITTSV